MVPVITHVPKVFNQKKLKLQLLQLQQQHCIYKQKNFAHENRQK